ncbi:Na+/H+ antiporter subunit A [Plantactinospora sp. KBS50]|uniref:Na+/H+ antiporter subunit A n=1 Tax=Plantactinospora sp. KBS50 TaxID=2024580 RepID=UPI000BAAD2BE|nr:Na+/H+ antiporter subunit A [Plantactinospora sp. KBS50]ASW54107.1 Na+/H+ antiporter subunit A [Plantactinospora sp. KBS50]
MLVLLILHLAAALVAPVLVRWWGRAACAVLALVPAATAGWAVARTGTFRDGGEAVETYRWIASLGLDLELRVEVLSWVLLLLVGGVGALVLVYCTRYFPSGEPELGRFAAAFVGFAGAMTGLVMADNLLLLYVFWELTSILSFLLIGHNPGKRATRRAATQALVVTTLGGLAMLVGFIVLGESAGTYRWSSILATGIPGGATATAATLLILTGVVTKSAIFPTSFWLPSAMAAPTPVSAYLHAAAMVKAGIFLVALLAPGLAEATPWHPVLYALGTVTMLGGGWAALRQVDLKLLLAYGTVSQLGLLLLLTGAATRAAALAGLVMLLAHGLFKSTLFLVAGAVDHAAGTRDINLLSGVGRRRPVLAGIAVLAAASMAGVPPLLGFVGKEAVVHALLDEPVLLAGVLAGAVLTAAYSVRFVWGAFGDRPGPRATTPLRPTRAALIVPPAVLAAAGLLLGPLAGPLGVTLAPYPGRFAGAPYQLVLWPGWNLALGLSVLALAGGAVLFVARDRVASLVARVRLPVHGTRVYLRVTHLLGRLAVEVTGVTQRGSLPQYLGTILTVLVLLAGGALLAGGPWPSGLRGWDAPGQTVVGLVLAVAALLTVRARRRITAMVLVGVTGYGTALLFILHGAPDLALTQFLVETVTIVVYVLVLRRLPAAFSTRPLRRSRWLRGGIGVAVGLVMSGLALAASTGRTAPSISNEFPDLAVQGGHGRNVVNVTLVDIRAWDTMGEISVLVVVATGVASLIFVRSARGRRSGRRDLPVAVTRGRERVWLRGGSTLTSRRRSIVFEVVTRLIFHVIVLFSIFLVFAGHNSPGGGFAGGLVAGLALAVRYLAGGRYELDDAAPVDAGVLLGAGLATSVGYGALALVAGRPALTSTLVDLHLPLVGEVHLVTSLFFDIGVYLVVVGLVLDVLRSLGAEIDRQIETGGGPELVGSAAGTAARGAAPAPSRAGTPAPSRAGRPAPGGRRRPAPDGAGPPPDGAGAARDGTGAERGLVTRPEEGER